MLKHASQGVKTSQVLQMHSPHGLKICSPGEGCSWSNPHGRSLTVQVPRKHGK